jgi:hypothetical protein
MKYERGARRRTVVSPKSAKAWRGHGSSWRRISRNLPASKGLLGFCTMSVNVSASMKVSMLT